MGFLLVSGQVTLEGKPEGNLGARVTKGNVYLDGKPICDKGWNLEDATVVCRWINHYLLVLSFYIISSRMLGYGLGVPELGSPYGPASVDEEFQYTEISCKGDEENLLDCSLKYVMHKNG